MTNPAATLANPAVATDTALAEALGVARRRIYKWRAEGAPAGLEVDAWATWLRRSGRATFADRLLNPSAAAGETDEPTAAQPRQLDLAEAMPAPATDASAAEVEKFYRGLKHKEEALAAALKRRQLERDLMPVADADAFARAWAALVLDELGSAIWRGMAPLLDGADPGLRRELRRAHDQALLDLRLRLPRVARGKLAALLTTP